MQNKGQCFSMVDRGQRNPKDDYKTPWSMVKQLLEREEFRYNILEACPGENSEIIKYLHKEGYTYYNTPKDYDFFKSDYHTVPNMVSNIITNPPYKIANQIIERGKEIYRNKMALLLPLSYLHGQYRYDNQLFNNLKVVYVFTRYPMLSGEVREDGKYKTGMMAYAWYVWQIDWDLPPEIAWIDNNPWVLRKSNG